MDRSAFFTKYAIDEEQFGRLGIDWEDLMEIRDEYAEKLPVYENTTRHLADLLIREKSIHSIKYRVKDSEHLIEKIIRKSAGDPAFLATFRNYETNVKDLIGLRALHLFKEDWVDVHNFLASNWDFYTAPRANYKKGDPASLLEKYSAMGCELNEHRNGYRSVHYHLLIKPGRSEMVAEVQVRTLFEEAWSEIDHYIRYGAKRETDQAEQYLGVLNNITSNADALASYINRMENHDKYAEAAERGAPRMKVREIYQKARYE